MVEDLQPIVEAAFAAEVTQNDLNDWYLLQKQLAAIKDQELVLRKKIFVAWFKSPKEGTNNLPLTDGWVLKAVYPVNRKVDVPKLSVKRQDLQDAGLKLDDLIKYKPEVSVTEYKKLTDEQRKLFDEILEISPGTPQMEIVLPKR